MEKKWKQLNQHFCRFFINKKISKIIQTEMMHCKIALLLLIVVLAASQTPKLIMVNELFRHGARYPVYPKSDDDSATYTFNEHSYGELTVNGKKMHYLLGQFLYKQYYQELFKGTPYQNRYNQSKFFIKSTDVNRTIESVQSQMMGVLENLDALYISQNMTEYSKPQWNNNAPINVKADYVFPNASSYHPIAIHVEKGGSQPYNAGDFLRTYSPENCPNQNVWIKQNKEDPRFKDIISNQNFTNAIKALSAEIGRNVSFWEAAQFYDNYECARYMGRNFLKVFTHPEYTRPMEYIHTIDMYLGLYSNQKQIKATATGFFNQTVHNIRNIIGNKEAVQWNIYSAHDTTVGNMLAALNLTNVECIYQAFLKNSSSNSDTCVSQYPKYTSNLIFEIWQYNSSYHSIKIRYNGQIKKIPFCDWKTECSVDAFYDWFNQFKDMDYMNTCGVYQKDIELYFSVAAAQFMIILVLVLAASIKCLQKRLNKSKEQNSKKPSGSSSSQPTSMMKDSLLSEEANVEVGKEN